MRNVQTEVAQRRNVFSHVPNGKVARQRIREDEARHAEGHAREPVAPGEFHVWVDEQDWGAATTDRSP